MKRKEANMKTMKALTATLIGAIAICSVTAYAGNVVKIVKEEDKSVPKYEETKYNATLKDYTYDASVAGGGFAKPIDGSVGEFLVQDIKLTMKEKKFKKDGIETEELGNVRILFSSSITGEDFIALLTDEQLKKLDKLLTNSATGGRPANVSTSDEYKPVHSSELIVAFKNRKVKGSEDTQGNIIPNGGKVGEVHVALGNTSGSTPSSKIIDLLSDKFEQGYFSTKNFGEIKVMFRKSDGAYVVFMTDKQKAQIKQFLSE